MFPACDLAVRHAPDLASAEVRADLQVSVVQRGPQTVYVVKDPVRLKYFELDEQEYELLQRLQGQVDWHALRRWFHLRFPPIHLTHDNLQQMVWRLYQQGLVSTLTAGQGARLAARSQQVRWRETWQKSANPLAIRLPGVSPAGGLAAVNFWCGWVMQPLFVVPACFALTLLAIILFGQQRELLAMTFQNQEFLTPSNLILLTLVVLVMKCVHEAGHALAAYRQGCECPEVGVMLLAGMPTLYCDVSDAWMLPNRWQRIAVSLAGVWLELLMAGLAAVVWCWTVPGLIHTLSFQVMLVCSLGTLLFNANPLLRYDGYYVLMDLAGVSNLGQRAHRELVRVLERSVLGLRSVRRIDEAELPWWCAWYGLASLAYRYGLTVAIFWSLHLALKPYAAQVLVWGLATITAVNWGVTMIRAGQHQYRRALRLGTPAWRVALGYAGAAGIAAACLWLPLPWYVFGEATLEPADRQTIVAAVAGELLQREEAGATVSAGSNIVQLENQELRLELARLEQARSLQQQHVQSLQSRRNQDRAAADQIPAAAAELSSLDHRLQLLRGELQRLTVVAPGHGQLYPSPPRLLSETPGDLPRWSGSLLEPENRQAWFEAGDEIGQIGTTDRWSAMALLSQADIELVAPGCRADLFIVATGRTFRGEVTSISRVKQNSPAARSAQPASHDKANSLDPAAQRAAAETYQVEIRLLEPCPAGLRIRSRSQVRIDIGTRTLGQWLAEWCYRTVRWQA